MKRTIIFILSLLLIILCFNVKVKGEILIPNEAIRFRVIANSNSIYDQEIKMKVTEEVQKYLYDILKNKTSINESRRTIKENVSTIEKKVDGILKNYNNNVQFNVKYGFNYFPEKTYKGVKYNKGNYESLLIELGQGNGDNWWCVLFPPLCLLDASKSEEVEYKFFVTELINKYFNK